MERERNSHNQKSLPARLFKRRKELRLTQREIGSRLNVAHGTYARYESGKIGIPASELPRFAKALLVPVSYLIDDDPGPAPDTEIRDALRGIEAKLSTPAPIERIRLAADGWTELADDERQVITFYRGLADAQRPTARKTLSFTLFGFRADLAKTRNSGPRRRFFSGAVPAPNSAMVGRLDDPGRRQLR